MTTAELGYQQKELEMLFNILKNRINNNEEWPEKPGFKLDGLAKSLFDMIKKIENNNVNFCDEHSRLVDEPQFKRGDKVQIRNGCGWTPIGPIMIVKQIINENQHYRDWETEFNIVTGKQSSIS